MKTLSRTIQAKVMTFDEAPRAIRWLLREAAHVRNNAQAPYSHFHVGVSVLAADDPSSPFSGCNVERVSYSQCTHAEQNAIDTMVATIGSAKLAVVALVAAPASVDPSWKPCDDGRIGDISDVPVPCGHCLQIIWENCKGDPDVELWTLTASGEVVMTTIGDALPFRFGPEDIGISY